MSAAHAKTATERRYPRKAEIARAVEAAKACGLSVGGIEIGPDGTIRVLQAAPGGLDSPYERWKAGRQGR